MRGSRWIWRFRFQIFCRRASTATPSLFSSPFASTALILRLSLPLSRNSAEKLPPSTNTKTNLKVGTDSPSNMIFVTLNRIYSAHLLLALIRQNVRLLFPEWNIILDQFVHRYNSLYK
uniref:Uncharacterized protein n=1 Tax=Picea sitchensis TaxID=3332 RepID=B8LNC0_PICSI|nr:unknown [Picea sitchensis]